MAPRAPSSAGRRPGGKRSGRTGTARRGRASPPGTWTQTDKYTLERDDGRAWIHRMRTVVAGAMVVRYRAFETGGDHYDGPRYVAPWRETLAAAKWDAADLID